MDRGDAAGTDLLIVGEAPVEEGLEDAVEVGDGVDFAHGVAEEAAGVHRFGVPTDAFAEFHDGDAFIAEVDEVVKMLADVADFLLDGRFRRDGAGGEVRPDIAEDPGVTEGTAADHEAGAAGDVQHALGVFGGADIAIADDGDFVDGSDDLSDAVEAGLAGEAHLRGAAMNGDEGDAGLFETFGEVRGDDGGVIPTEAELAGERGAEEAAFDFVDHAEGVVGVAEEFGASVLFGDFVDGAAHIDVDDVGAFVLSPHGGFAEFVDIAAIELHAERGIFGAGGGKFHGAFVFAEDAVGGEQVRAGETDAAAGAGDEAEGDIAVAGDGGEEEVGGEFDVADFERSEGHGVVALVKGDGGMGQGDRVTR